MNYRFACADAMVRWAAEKLWKELVAFPQTQPPAFAMTPQCSGLRSTRNARQINWW
jgi:hypothetical protein